jgi:hypothetical protein
VADWRIRGSGRKGGGGLLEAFKDHSSAIVIAQERASEYTENKETADERAEERLDALYPWVNQDTRVVLSDITFGDRATSFLGPIVHRALVCGAGLDLLRSDISLPARYDAP